MIIDMSKEEIEEMFFNELRSAFLTEKIPNGEFVIKITNGNDYEVELLEMNGESYETD